MTGGSVKPSGMQTSAGRAEDAMERTGRSGHTPGAADSKAQNTKQANPESLWSIATIIIDATPWAVRRGFGGRMISRRDFGRAALAGVPLSTAWSADPAEIQLGVATYSFRD